MIKKLMLLTVFVVASFYGLADNDLSNSVKMYITNLFGNDVTICTMNNTTTPISCTNHQLNNLLSGPAGIVITGSSVYITNAFSNSITECEFNNAEIISKSCRNANIKGVNTPVGIALSPNEKFLYIANSTANNYTECDLSKDNNLSDNNCNTITPYERPYTESVLYQPNSMVFTSNEAIITNYGNNSYSVCKLSTAGNIDSTACQNYIPQPQVFSSPSGIVAVNNYIYIANYGNNTYTRCRFSSDYMSRPLYDCNVYKSNSINGIFGPAGMSVYSGKIFFANAGVGQTDGKTYTYCIPPYASEQHEYCQISSESVNNLLNSPFSITFSAGINESGSGDAIY